MKITFLSYICAITITSTLSAEEGWRFQVNASDKPSVVYELADGEKMSFMSYYIKFDTISDEVALLFQKEYPNLWKEAQKSSGNTHNPKVLPLRKKFTEILLKTHAIKKLDMMARESGFTIAGASHEKFHFMKNGDENKVFAVIWLTITKQAEQEAASNSLSVK